MQKIIYTNTEGNICEVIPVGSVESAIKDVPEGFDYEIVDINYNVKLSDKQKQIEINSDSLTYLLKTDWYVTRMSETGVIIPKSVLSDRAKARTSIKYI